MQNKQAVISIWVDAYTQKMYQWAYHKCKDEGVAKDLVQDTFLVAIESYEKFKGNSKPLTWLFGILNNKLNDYFKSRAKTGIDERRANQYADDFFDEEGHWNKDFPSQEWQEEKHLLDNPDFIKIFKLCVSHLPPVWRDALLQKYIFGKNSLEICQELGVTDTNYWQVIHRAKLLVRKCIEKILERLIMGMTINCKEATLLLEKKHDMPIGVKENIQLFYHLTICKACSLYQKQSKFLEKALRRSVEIGEENKNLEELKQKIKDLLIKS